MVSNAKDFIDRTKLSNALAQAARGRAAVEAALAKARELKGLSLHDAATLATCDDPETRARILAEAGKVKEAIYGRRMVVFAPLYVGNVCANDCLYCSFRSANRELPRRSLSLDEVEAETRVLLRQGHKRLLMLQGEEVGKAPQDGFLAAIERAYSVKEGGASIRRINVEIAPLDVEGFRRLKSARIGTYACFQETYDRALYARFHRSGPKADFLWRLTVMDRAMEAGIDDVGIGALFGLGDWRFELLGLLSHAAHLEAAFGCGPHTVSVPRIEAAEGAPAALSVPSPVCDDDFRLLVAILRLALPYTGIILSTRESDSLRNELFRYGVSQISAGSRTDPGAYAADAAGTSPAVHTGAQFQLGDHRSLEEVVTRLAADGFVPSFCTGCYRKGRTGADFMDLAKPGLIRRFCEPNAAFTFAEYLADYAGAEARVIGERLIERVVAELPDDGSRRKAREALASIGRGERDVYV